MLDPALLRKDPGRIAAMLRDRGVEFDLDGLILAEKEYREFIPRIDAVRQKKNELGRRISEEKKSGADASGTFQDLEEISTTLADMKGREELLESEYQKRMRAIPNLTDKSVPVGDASANVETSKWGSPPSFHFEPKNHVDLAEELGLIDIERASKVSGARFYYLKDDLVLLNQALIKYSLDFAQECGYSLLQPPYMINRESMSGATIPDDFEDVIYRIQDEDLYMIGTSEHAMAAMHAGEILDGKSLPIRYAGTSPCFRKEAGAHGRDQKGIFRVHQFEKIEQFVYARPEESWEEHERMLEKTRLFYERLGIPHRTVLLSSMDMGKTSAKTYDIEAWMAGQGAYREIVSCSNCLDYQSRRLMIRFRDSTDAPTSYPHTLNSTLAATTRVLVAIIENFQDGDGHISVPGVLAKYMGKNSMP